MIKKYIILALLLLPFLFSACSKEQNTTNRMQGKWLVDEMMIDNIDVLYPMQELSFYDIEMDYYEDGGFEINTRIGIESCSSSYRFTGSWQITDTHLTLQYHESEIGCLIGIFMPSNNLEEYEISELTKGRLILTSLNQSETVIIEAKIK